MKIQKRGKNTFRLTWELGLDPEWYSDPGYAHTWDYWDYRVQTVLAWMFENDG